MTNNNDNPVTLITGASAGIGQEVAKLLAKKGHRLVLVARRQERLNQLVTELGSDVATASVMDLADLNAIDGKIRDIEQQVGPIDHLINNAGYNIYMPTLELSADEHAKIMAVNYFAPLHLIKATLPGMVERKRGHIINVASIATKFGPPNHSSYAAAKAGLVSLTQSLACEYENSGVHFSYVNPGIVKTEFFDDASYKPMQNQIAKHGISAGYVARKIVKLFDRPRLEVCVPKHFRMLELIRALSPGLAYKLMVKATRNP